MPDLTRIQREATAWFISVGPPTEIVLVPTVTITAPGKGTKKQPGTPRDSQLFKKIWPGGDGQIEGIDGTIHKFDMIIVGLWDCVAEVGDVWSEGEQKYVLHSEYPYNGYERKFGVNSYGGVPSD